MSGTAGGSERGKRVKTDLSADLVGYRSDLPKKDGQREAVLFYPEYFESYDEIAPAHIFGRNIEERGFRARQSFLNGAVDFVQYDTIFPKACAEENDKTLQKIVTDRLLYPVDLKEVAREIRDIF